MKGSCYRGDGAKLFLVVTENVTKESPHRFGLVIKENTLEVLRTWPGKAMAGNSSALRGPPEMPSAGISVTQ